MAEIMAKGMNDVVMKPQMLYTLIKEDLPQDKRPFGSPSTLSRIVSILKTHKLLAETPPQQLQQSPTDPKYFQRWKSAVDNWVSRLLLLVDNQFMPDKCWAGICLLGVTCQQCSSERFLASYALWLEKLLPHMQSPTDSQFVKVASCTSIQDLITRLAEYPSVKKDATSHAGKLFGPLLKLLTEGSSENVLEAAAELLCAIIIFFPASLHRHYDNAEAAIASKILSSKCNDNVLKKLARCLALLPKSKGDEDSWLLMMRKILLMVNGYLTEIFHGIEEVTKWDEAVRLLIAPGEVPPFSLWGQQLLEEASDRERKRNKISCVSMFMLSCSIMLTTLYPVQVTVPVRSLLALVERVLMVDGSVPESMSQFVIASEQEFICCELPVLHDYSLELLVAIVRGMRSQLLPHAAYAVRLVKEYFRRCEVPELRVKVYSITKMLLISMGVGIAIYLAQEVVNNSLVDLIAMDMASHAHLNVSSEAFLHSYQRKRKHSATGSFEQQDIIGSEVEAQKNSPSTQISVKIAALEALEALLTVGGALRSDSWRPKVDDLLITISVDCCKDGWASEERNNLLNGHTSKVACLQLAALRALLASLLSPSHMRPPHLAQALELFRRGRQETGTKLAEFCAHALLTLEVLIHPRALPADFPSASTSHAVKGSYPVYSDSQMLRKPFSSGIQEERQNRSDSDDDLYTSWLGSGKEAEGPIESSFKNVDIENPSGMLRFDLEKNICVAESFGQKSPGISRQEAAVGNVGVEMGSTDDRISNEVQDLQETTVQLQESVSSEVTTVAAVTKDAIVTKMDLTTNQEPGVLHSVENEMQSGELGHDSSTESIPEIVDVDPDSDSD
ncbi:hypothetical protein K2173_024251 [Erythroxylum novogranatense]|uniref:Pre-rRNA-processing protein RIX1 N-terminal domain-containing protein n=1 Tax=Erythroxylum novogranatense TaxID=1862640 RepID=A0AAV8UCB8_9ROSI|nr:hypothetical protein K2173_024251 [Erythroxylum novogranatense]